MILASSMLALGQLFTLVEKEYQTLMWEGQALWCRRGIERDFLVNS